MSSIRPSVGDGPVKVPLKSLCRSRRVAPIIEAANRRSAGWMNDQVDNIDWVGPEGALDELARRTAMLDAVGYAATKIVVGDDWRAGIQELLNRLGHATGASRVSLFELHLGPDHQLAESCRYDWTEPGMPPMSDDPRYRNMPLVDEHGVVDDWTLRRQRGEVVQAKLRDLTGYNRQVFEDTSTLSFISVPIMLRGGCWGFLAFDDCHREREWTPVEIDVLRTAASLVGGAIERAKADERLRLSEERYALAARGAADGLWDWDVGADRAYFSPRLHEILGLSDGALGDSVAALFGSFDAEDAARVRDYFRVRFADGKRKFRFEARSREPAEHPRWFVARGMIVYGDGRPARVVGSMRDITDVKQADDALRANEARVRAILDTALDAVISIDEAGRIVEFNQAASRIFGWARDEALGRVLADLIIPPGLREKHKDGLRRYVATGDSRILGRLIEVEGQRADGSLVPVELTIAEVPLQRGRLFTGILRDISERRRFQAQLSDTERRRAVLARHFSPNMVDELMRSGGQLDAVRTQPLTVLFADLFNFTALSATMRVSDVVELLRSFHTLVEEAVFGNEGTLDKYIGDGVMATFGTPRPGPRDATNALAGARAIVKGINRWNRDREAAGRPPLRIGVGLHYGEATLGNVGSARRFEHTVVGETVNLASRIEQLTRVLDIAILVSEAVVEAVEREGGESALAGLVDVGSHAIRGHKRPMKLWGTTALSLGAD